MKRLAWFVLALCLFGLPDLASSAENITVTPVPIASRNADSSYALGTVTVGQKFTTTLALKNVSGAANTITKAVIFSGNVEVNKSVVAMSSVDVSLAAPGGTINLAPSGSDLSASFPGGGEAMAINQTINMTLRVTPHVVGNMTVAITFNQSVVGDDGFFFFALTVTPIPQPVPIKPFVSFFFDAPDMSGSVSRVPAHLIWGGDSPALVLDPDYGKIVWKRNGRSIATGKDPWLELASGDTVTVSAISVEGVIYTSSSQVFTVPSLPAPTVYVPPDPGQYTPKKKGGAAAATSAKVYSKTKAGSRRGKVVAIQAAPGGASATWGQIKQEMSADFNDE